MPYPTKKLGEITKTIRGVTYKPKDVLDKENGLACFRTKNIQKQLDESDIYYIDYSIVKNEEKLLQNGDLLISSANSLELLGKCCLIENLGYKATLGGFISCFRPIKEFIDYNYFYYYYNSNNTQKLVRSFSRKTTGIANLKIKDVEKIPIPLPPLPTQKLIVQKLDSAFKNIDESIKITKKNIENIEELNKSTLEKCINNTEFKKVILKSLLDKCEYGSSEKASSTKEEGLPILRMGNIQNGGIDYNKLKYSDKKSKTLPKLYLKKDDLLFNRTNSWELVGKTGIYLGADDEYTFAGYLIRLKFTDKVLQKYGNYFFNSQFFRKTQIEPQIDQQCGQANFSGGKLKETTFLLPPLSKQKEIVAYLDEVFEKNKVIKEGYEKKLKDLEEMKQSILKEAFEGRLVE